MSCLIMLRVQHTMQHLSVYYSITTSGQQWVCCSGSTAVGQQWVCCSGSTVDPQSVCKPFCCVSLGNIQQIPRTCGVLSAPCAPASAALPPRASAATSTVRHCVCATSTVSHCACEALQQHCEALCVATSTVSHCVCATSTATGVAAAL